MAADERPHVLWTRERGYHVHAECAAELAKYGLHIVTAADMAVLEYVRAEILTCEAEAARRDPEDGVHIQADGYRHIRAELARREQKR